MRVLHFILFFIVAISLSVVEGYAQQTNDSKSIQGITGKIIFIDLTAKKIKIKQNDGNSISVKFNDKTVFSKISLNAKTTNDAVKISVSEIKNGDRLFARGNFASAEKNVNATSIIILPQTEVQQKQEIEKQRWLENGIFGKVAAISIPTKEITLLIKDNKKEKSIIVEAVSENVRFRRYAPDSVKYEDALTSDFSQIKVGDRLRALGKKSVDGKRFKPEEIISGSFKTYGGTIQSINPQAKQITIKTLSDKKPVVISLSENSLMRQISPKTASIIINEIVNSVADKKSSQKSDLKPNLNTKKGDGEAKISVQNAIESSPMLKISGLKKGDKVMFTIANVNSKSNAKAIVFLTGVETVLNLFKPVKKKNRSNILGAGIPLSALNSVDLQ